MEWIKAADRGEEEAADACAEVLKRGGVTVFPAERLYGLAADAADAAAVMRVFELKRRPLEQLLPVIAADLDMAAEWALLNELAMELAQCFWPGPLTMVLAAKKNAAPGVTDESMTVGIRVPGNGLARAIAGKLGRPVTATSANPTGEPAPRDPAFASSRLFGEPDLVIDAGELPGPPGSTVVRVDEEVAILREGAILKSEIEKTVKGKVK